MGKIEVFNQAISKMLKIRNIRFISDLEKIKDDLPSTLMGLKARRQHAFQGFHRG